MIWKISHDSYHTMKWKAKGSMISKTEFPRKNNVVFFGVSEAEGSTREDKMANNKAKIMRIANEVGMQLKEEDILSFKRLGKMGQMRVIEDEEVPVPRLLLATFTEAAKASLMKNAYKLQFSSEMKEIRIKHDMSKED